MMRIEEHAIGLPTPGLPSALPPNCRAPCVGASRLSASRSIRTCRSHTPGSPHPPHSPIHHHSRRRSSPTPHPAKPSAPKMPADAPPRPAVSTPLPLPRSPACTPASPAGTRRPTADRLLRLSAFPALPPPSPLTSPDTIPPPPPVPPPVFAGSAPVGSPAGSALHSSPHAIHSPPRSVRESAPPAPRTVRVCNDPRDMVSRSDSTPPQSALSLHRSAD